MVTVGWILAREFIKLYVARQAKRLGSRIRTKLVIGAMLLSCVPVFFLVLWSYEVLNVNLKAWFTNPVNNQVEVYKGAAKALDQEIQHRLAVQAAPSPPSLKSPASWPAACAPGSPERFAGRQGLESVAILSAANHPLETWGPSPRTPGRQVATARIPLANGAIELATRIPDADSASWKSMGSATTGRKSSATARLLHSVHHADAPDHHVRVSSPPGWRAFCQPHQHPDHSHSRSCRRGPQRQPATSHYRTGGG
jgi:hypothetical protein